MVQPSETGKPGENDATYLPLGLVAVRQERKFGQMRIVLRVAMVLFGTVGYIAMGVVLTGTG